MLDPGTYTVEAVLEDLHRKIKFTLENVGNIPPVDFGLSDKVTGIDGVWKTDKVKASLFSEGKKVHGFYTTNNDELLGEMTYPKRFEEYWIKESSNTRCESPQKRVGTTGDVSSGCSRTTGAVSPDDGTTATQRTLPQLEGEVIRPLNDKD